MTRECIFLISLAITATACSALAQDPSVLLAQSFQARQANRDDPDYQNGLRALDARQWDQAISSFGAAADHKGSQIDAALYWKAYAENRAGRREEALSTISELRDAYPSSRWVNDARALEVEVRAQSGTPVSPAAEQDENLKLIAINSLMQSDPDKALPILQKLLLSSNNPAKVKERALFVLTQNPSPQARKLLGDIVRGQSNPDLQLKAIRYMGMMGSEESRKELASLYSSSSDERIKRAILQSMFLEGNSAKLADIARSDKNPALRVAAIRSLGLMGDNGRGDVLVSIYQSDPNREVREAVLNALFLQHDGKALVALARSEKDPRMKQKIVEKMALVHSKETTNYMMEILR